MINHFVACGLLLVLFAGCGPAMPIMTEVYPASPFASTPTITSTSIPTNSLSTDHALKFYFPKIEKRCPENREVSFDELDIGSDRVAILLDLNRTGLWRYSTEDQGPILIKTIPFDTWSSISLNPTGELLAFIIRNEDNSSSIWLLPLILDSTKEIFRIDYFEGAYPNMHWVSDNELLINGSCAGAGCPFPIKLLNVANGIQVDVEDTYTEPHDNYIGFVVNAGELSAVYGSYADDGYSQFYAYDYITDQKIPVFPWLDEKIFFFPLIGTNLRLLDTDKNFAMVVEQSYGFDIGVLDAKVEQLTQSLPYESVMKRIFTEIQFSDLKYFLVDLNPSNKNLMMSMSYVDYVADTVDMNNIVNALFAIDWDNPLLDDRLDRLSFVDFCFSTTEYFNHGFSPDGQIEVFKSDDNEVVFLNLETGNISRLSGWLFLGWAK